MKIEVSKEGSVTIVEPLEARLDAQRAVGFKAELTGLVDAGEHQIVLDLNCVEFMDSSGLGAVVAVLKRLGFLGVLIICGARAPVAGLFKLTRMDKVIKLVATREEALTAASVEALGKP